MKIMDTAGSNRDSALWRNHWEKKLTEVMEIQWQQALLKGVTLPMTVRTVLIGKKCSY
jgi:hypothetical protein